MRHKELSYKCAALAHFDVLLESALCGCSAVEGPKENRAAIVREEGWEEWLLELVLDGSPCIPGAEEQASLD